MADEGAVRKMRGTLGQRVRHNAQNRCPCARVLQRCPGYLCIKDLNERARVREEARTSGGAWPPQAGVRPIRQENKLLVPAAFSPVR